MQQWLFVHVVNQVTLPTDPCREVSMSHRSGGVFGGSSLSICFMRRGIDWICHVKSIALLLQCLSRSYHSGLYEVHGNYVTQ